MCNATVLPPAPFWYLTLWAQAQPQPLAATLNAVDGAITSDLAITPTRNGMISAFASDPTHLVLDVFGYFSPRCPGKAALKKDLISVVRRSMPHARPYACRCVPLPLSRTTISRSVPIHHVSPCLVQGKYFGAQ
jgi:hypothetical protein